MSHGTVLHKLWRHRPAAQCPPSGTGSSPASHHWPSWLGSRAPCASPAWLGVRWWDAGAPSLVPLSPLPAVSEDRVWWPWLQAGWESCSFRSCFPLAASHQPPKQGPLLSSFLQHLIPAQVSPAIYTPLTANLSYHMGFPTAIAIYTGY